MLIRTDELRFALNEIANLIANEVPEIDRWEAMLVYLLEDLELMAASLDPDHPENYRTMLKQLRRDINMKLKKDSF